MLFDEPYYLAINEQRWTALARMLDLAREAGVALDEIIDLGCGPGWFSARLASTGSRVRGYDARPELIEIAGARAPEAHFATLDMDAVGLGDLPPPADAVVCFGLLYHLENPIRALRICRALARTALFLETMTMPEPEALGRLIPESDNITQGVRPAAFLLTPDAVIHSLRLAGFRHVHRYTAPIDHEDFVETPTRKRRRDMFLASDTAIAAADLTLATPAPLMKYPYAKL